MSKELNTLRRLNKAKQELIYSSSLLKEQYNSRRRKAYKIFKNANAPISRQLVAIEEQILSILNK